MSDVRGELNSLAFGSYAEAFGKMRELAAKYGDLSVDGLISAFGAAGFGGVGPWGNMNTANPAVQNRRVKGIETRPANYTKTEVAKFVQAPDGSERELRAVEKGLEYSAYPMYHTRTVYQNLLTYHSYIAPRFTDREAAKQDDFWREWRLLEKLRTAVDPKDRGHELAGLALQEGKVFVAPRVRWDKSHNQIDYAFLQQLPSDWVKIVGFNNVSKYTVAFNLMYFAQYGTDWRQFGDLFEPYIGDFLGALSPLPTVAVDGERRKVIYASRSAVNLANVRRNADERVDAYYQNGRWFYWVTLPVDRVFPFEIDDADRNVVPPFAGLFIDMIQLSQMEQIQLELLQNPLVSLLHGEIPYWDTKETNTADQYKLSDAGRRLFEYYWYQMLARNNTSGIGLFMAPLENMKLETLSEAPSAISIVSQGYEDLSAKTGLSALIPATADARAGAVQVSLAIESRFPQTIYTCFERMMNCIIGRMNLKYDWVFRMFGDLATDKERKEELRNCLTFGILSDWIEYNALSDRSILDDLAWSDAIIESGLMDRRLPLVSSYNASNKDGNLPPQLGRPKSDDPASSEGHEQDIDQGRA